MATVARPHSHVTFTCSTCRVRFPTLQDQRDHHHSAWHNHNMQRKLIKAEPLDEAAFTVMIAAQQNQEENEASVLKCLACNQTCASERQYLQHLQSRKHQERQQYLSLRKNASQEVEGGEGMVNDTELVILNECLFCGHASNDLDANMHHMTIKHSFFIPDAEYLSDKAGLITYLSQKLTVQHTCLWCYSSQLHVLHEDSKGVFRSLRDVRRHMLDKGHCKILYEGGAEREIEQFYDFQLGGSDEEIHMVKKVVKSSQLRSGGDDGEEWEDVEGDDETLTIASTVIENTVLAHTSKDPVTMDLILPSGHRIGHRIGHRRNARFVHRDFAPSSTPLSSSALFESVESAESPEPAESAEPAESLDRARVIYVTGTLPSQRNNQALMQLSPQNRAIVAKQEARMQHVIGKRKKHYQLQTSMKDNMNLRQRHVEPFGLGGFNH